jgi:hypothetical protein
MLDAGHAGADAGVFGDGAAVVLRDVEVGADENALATGLALGTQIGEADDGHGGCVGWMKNLSILWSTRSLVLDPRQSL